MRSFTKKIAHMRTHDHSGWTDAEDEILFNAVAEAKVKKAPLKAAFDIVAKETDRKPNSIRNYYYLRIRDDDIIRRYNPDKAASFVPFSDDEVHDLLRRILSDQGKGISVRASTMALAGGDMTEMLRYQNKYRSILKTAPELVSKVVEELRSEGISAHDPYVDTPVKNSGRPRKKDGGNDFLLEMMSETVEKLYDVEGLDVPALFECLGTLADSAGKGAEAIHIMRESQDAREYSAMRDENAELHERIREQESELAAKRADLYAMSSAMHDLIGINKAFIESSVNIETHGSAVFDSYIHELAKALSKCSAAVAT